MNPEIKKLWIEKLKVLPQGRDQLRTEEGYCCLGALCEVYIESTGKGRFDATAASGYMFRSDEAFEELVLPPEVIRWAGLDSDFPTVPKSIVPPEHQWISSSDKGDREGTVELGRLNDAGVAFPEIAALIDKAL